MLFQATLRGRTLTISTAVEATGDRSVPVAFGYHPYLRLPHVERSAWEVEMPVTERLELDERMLPTGKRSPVTVRGRAARVKDLRRCLRRARRR